jgi:hypothetical protein
MHARDRVRAMVVRLIGAVLRRRRKPAFTCGECERWQRCGLPPSEHCIIMVTQLARDGRPVRRLGLPAA